jgi:3-oxoacyl-[acyl-carrier-protein] synthase II
MRNALLSAELDASQIDYVNAHGTSTLAGDIAETQAIKSVFGAHAASLAVSSTKSMIGHLLGASGAAEAIVTILSLKHQILTPTINLETPDEGCNLDYVPHTARDASLKYALSNSFGFGGTNGSLIFAQYT